MKPVTVAIKLHVLAEATAPAFYLAPSRQCPALAFIDLDIDSGEITVVTSERRPAIERDVWDGLVRRFALNPLASGRALAEFLRGEAFLTLAQRILTGTTTFWDKERGEPLLTDDARAAEDELQVLIEQTFAPGSSNVVAVHDLLGRAAGDCRPPA